MGEQFWQVADRYLDEVCKKEKAKLASMSIKDYTAVDKDKEAELLKKLDRGLNKSTQKLELAQKRQHLQPPGIQRQT